MKQNEPAGGGDDGAVTSAGLRDGVIAGAIILPVKRALARLKECPDQDDVNA